MDRQSCVLIKLVFTKRGGQSGFVWPVGHDLPIPVLDPTPGT